MSVIVIIEDDPGSREALASVLAGEGHQVRTAENGRDGIFMCQSEVPDLVITDLRLPGIDGIQVLEAVRTLSPDLPVMVISGEGTVEQAVAALKAGAVDYLTKPLRLREVLRAVAPVLETSRLQKENRELRKLLAKIKGSRREIVGAQSGLASVIAQVERVAPTRATVLLTGESGTGKEVIASLIHQLSPRHDQPFIRLNCAVLPEHLLESELFGHEKGAFTGAERSRTGLFEAAHQGSLFLDEVSELTSPLQAKLLRVLQEGEFTRLGSPRPVRVDVRIVAASNQDLAKAIASRTFREDLYYRLNVVTIQLPPLRERKDDIPTLARVFLAQAVQEHGRSVERFSPEAMVSMVRYHWPGNVRELENAVHRAVVLCETPQIGIKDLPPAVEGTLEGAAQETLRFQVGTSLEVLERLAITQTLVMTRGDKVRAANLLGIGLATLYRKLKDYENPSPGGARKG